MKTKIAIVLMCLSALANAQFSAGVKLNLGLASIRSANLASNLDYQRNANPKISEWSVTNRWGYDLGFGGFVALNFSDNFSFVAEPAIDFMQCGIDVRRVENKLDNNGDGDIVTSTLVSDINLTYFNLPLLARFVFPKNSFLIEGGIGINFMGTPTVSSTSTVQKDNYKNGLFVKRNIDPLSSIETKLNVFTSPRYSFILGVGKLFNMGKKDLTVSLRYNIPLTQSEMYTTDGTYNDGIFAQNNFLGIDGKTDAEKNAPYLLNDFKMSTLILSINFTLFKN